MRKVPSISTTRAAEIYKEVLAYRRIYCADTEFFRMTDFWDWMCSGSGDWSVKLFESNLGDDYKKKAGVVAFGNLVTLTVDRELWDRASQRCRLANFILAHEIGHLALDHHAKNAVTKHFQLFLGPRGMSNIPPTLEEMEANLAAVFLQCGVALENVRWDALDLANRACCDIEYVKRAQRFVRLDVFQKELKRMSITRYPRVVL
jgi:hypothetical protein